eukprot:jgi/Psemu1/18847/gm1.18847_g
MGTGSGRSSTFINHNNDHVNNHVNDHVINHVNDHDLSDHVNDHVNEDRTESYLSALERRDVTSTNLTLPIALMGLDPDRYPRERLRCCVAVTLALAVPAATGVFCRGWVGNRVYPLDSIARRGLYKTILEKQQRLAPSSSLTLSLEYNYKYNTLGDSCVKSKFPRFLVAYEDDCMSIVVKPPGLRSSEGYHQVTNNLPTTYQHLTNKLLTSYQQLTIIVGKLITNTRAVSLKEETKDLNQDGRLHGVSRSSKTSKGKDTGRFS